MAYPSSFVLFDYGLLTRKKIGESKKETTSCPPRTLSNCLDGVSALV